MVEKDYFGPPVVIKKSLVFSQRDLYKHLKKSFKDNGYSVNEKSYDEGMTSDGSKTVSFLWEGKKKASEYAHLMITLEFEAVFNDVKVKKGDGEVKAQKGDVTLKFASFIKRDPESEWELNKRNPFNVLLREMYDKFVKRGKMGDISGMVESDLSRIVSDAKLFLKLRRYD